MQDYEMLVHNLDLEAFRIKYKTILRIQKHKLPTDKLKEVKDKHSRYKYESMQSGLFPQESISRQDEDSTPKSHQDDHGKPKGHHHCAFKEQDSEKGNMVYYDP